MKMAPRVLLPEPAATRGGAEIHPREPARGERPSSGLLSSHECVSKQACRMWTPLDYGAEDFRKITEPTLVVTGDRDELIGVEQALGMHRLMANAELAILPNASHRSATGKLFTETALDFLLRHSTTASHGE